MSPIRASKQFDETTDTWQTFEEEVIVFELRRNIGAWGVVACQNPHDEGTRLFELSRERSMMIRAIREYEISLYKEQLKSLFTVQGGTTAQPSAPPGSEPEQRTQSPKSNNGPDRRPNPEKLPKQSR